MRNKIIQQVTSSWILKNQEEDIYNLKAYIVNKGQINEK